MRPLIMSLIVFLLMVSSAYAGNIWDLVKNSDLPTIPAKSYQLDVKGVNTRVYVFKVKEMNSVCIITYGDETSSQMVCKTYSEMER